MIGPSGRGTDLPAQEGELLDDQIMDGTSSKRKILEESDVDDYCEKIVQSCGRKRYLQETEASLRTPLEVNVDAETYEEIDERSVARLKVLVVDGTNYTWTTLSELDRQEMSFSDLSDNSNVSLLASSCADNYSAIPTSRASSDVRVLVEESCEENSFWLTTDNSTVPHVSSSRRKFDGTMRDRTTERVQLDDQENGNLSWLLNFKLDPFIEAADDREWPIANVDSKEHGGKCKTNNRATTTYPTDFEKRKVVINGNGNENASTWNHQYGNQNSSHEPIESRDFSSTTPCTGGAKKPPFTYTELIEHALQERGELTVSAIYQWISEHFPYYKSNDDRWKNSVRHNLSINPHFRKGSKAPHGAGHLWAIANRVDTRPRQQSTVTTDSNKTISRCHVKNSTDNSGDSLTEKLAENGTTTSRLLLLDEVEAATASIAQTLSEEETQVDIVDSNNSNSSTLEHCAEQILNGIKKEVEVQYLVPMMAPIDDSGQNVTHRDNGGTADLRCSAKESDFLNPISKEIVAEECGLISEGYLLTDMTTPAALGLNAIESEIISPENLFGEELNFHFYELSCPSQLQSA